MRIGILGCASVTEYALIEPARANPNVMIAELCLGEQVTRETLATRSSYSFQLDEFVGIVRRGAPIRTPAADAVANMDVIDRIYRHAGLRPRGQDE